MKSDTEEPANHRPTLIKVGRRKAVRIARRLTRLTYHDQLWSVYGQFRASYKVTKQVELFATAQTLFNRRYSTFGLYSRFNFDFRPFEPS
jgi:hypothetical protein